MKKSLLFLMVLGLFVFGNWQSVYADNANMTINTATNECATDEMITVDIEVDAETDIKKVDVVINYDEEMLEFQRAGSYITKEEDGKLKLYDTSTGGKTRKYSLTFKTLKSGITKVSCNNVPDIIASTGNKFVSSFTDLYVEIKGVEVRDGDTALKTLKVSPGTLNKEFKGSVKSYKLDVPYSAKNVVINAIPNSKKATVTISGDDKLKVGTNKVKITVIAEDETEEDYLINVTRMSEDEQLIADRKEYISSKKDKGNVYLESDGTYVINDSEYEVLDIKEDDSMEIPVGYKKSTMDLYSNEIDVCVLESDPKNDLFLIYAKNTESGDTGYYQYDRVERTIQRYFGKTVTIGNEKSKETFENAEYADKLRILGIIIGILAVISVVAFSLAIKMALNIRTIKNDNYLI